MRNTEFESMNDFMRKVKLSTRLKWLGVNKSFFTKARTKSRIKSFVKTMHEKRREEIVDPLTWNQAALEYGYLRIWDPSINTPDIQIGEEAV